MKSLAFTSPICSTQSDETYLHPPPRFLYDLSQINTPPPPAPLFPFSGIPSLTGQLI